MNRIKNIEFTFTLAKIIVLFFQMQRYFSKSLSKKKIIKFKINHVNNLQIKPQFEKICKSKKLYSYESLKVKVILKNAVKITILLNSKAEINVMIKRLMQTTNLIMQSKPRLRFISHTGHEMNFEKICRNVNINIKKVKS